MKKTVGVLLSLVLVLICAFALADVEINETNFPDEMFRVYVQEYDADGNGFLCDTEIANVTELYISHVDISSFQGIGYFTALKDFRSIDNYGLAALDVSGCTALETLHCYGDYQLESLNVSGCDALKELYCFEDQLKSLDVSHNPALEKLYCDTNCLTSLNIGKNKALTHLMCQNNQIQSLVVSSVPALNSLVRSTKARQENDYRVWEADDDSDGVLDRYLVVDENVLVVTDAPLTIDISAATVTKIKNQLVTGKAIKPAIIVSFHDIRLTKGKDYTVSYKNNRKVGTATVVITGKGAYSGKLTATFKIVPRGVKLSSLTPGKKEMTVKWAKGSGITGYEIEYSLKKNFKDAKTVTIKKAATTKTILKKLQAKKTYYVRIRAYKTVNGKKYYSAWSAIKNKKTK